MTAAPTGGGTPERATAGPPTDGATRRSALDAALEVLACPRCLDPLRWREGALGCDRGHAYDVARQGYAALAPGAAVHGDTGPMVRARLDLLATGAFDAVVDAVIATVPEGPGWCLDLAGGPGTYLARVLDARPELAGLCLDVAPAAARAAAGAHPRLAAATADLLRTIPVRDGAVRHALGIFGPRNGPETARVLAAGGVLTVVTPLPEHLAELREPFGTLAVGADKAAQADARLAPLRRDTAVEVRDARVLTPSAAADAVLMGPSGHHLDAAAVRGSAASSGPLEVTIAVTVTTYLR